jgi:uncharacterized protein
VSTDFLEAAKWARRAAEQGDARAQADLGSLYEQGKGVPLDYVSAYRWYSLAAEGGDEGSRTSIKSLSRLMTKQQINAAAAIPVPPSRRQGEANLDNETFRTSFAEPH